MLFQKKRYHISDPSMEGIANHIHHLIYGLALIIVILAVIVPPQPQNPARGQTEENYLLHIDNAPRVWRAPAPKPAQRVGVIVPQYLPQDAPATATIADIIALVKPALAGDLAVNH